MGLNADYVRQVAWWEWPDFQDRVSLQAAELVAFDVLDPDLRSRGGIPASAEQHANQPSFRSQMVSLFGGPPTGRLILPSLPDLANRVAALERRLEDS